MVKNSRKLAQIQSNSEHIFEPFAQIQNNWRKFASLKSENSLSLFACVIRTCPRWTENLCLLFLKMKMTSRIFCPEFFHFFTKNLHSVPKTKKLPFETSKLRRFFVLPMYKSCQNQRQNHLSRTFRTIGAISHNG